jgi:hypothetical protein
MVGSFATINGFAIIKGRQTVGKIRWWIRIRSEIANVAFQGVSWSYIGLSIDSNEIGVMTRSIKFAPLNWTSITYHPIMWSDFLIVRSVIEASNVLVIIH